MKTPFRIPLIFLTVLLLGLVPAVVPVGGSVAPAAAASCVPTESTFTGNGTIGTNGTPYQVLTFTTVGSCDWTVPSGVTVVEALVVGGGASGGRGQCGIYWGTGGGGGGVSLGSHSVSVSSVISVTVGSGGAATDTSCADASGSSSGALSSLGSIASATGGLGTDYNTKVGGSSGTPTSTSASARNLGGTGTATGGFGCGDPGWCGSGGGGGAGGPGSGSTGGAGIVSTISGASVTYGSGGAGRDDDGYGAASSGGGVSGSEAGSTPGSGGADGGSFVGAGASGIVIARYVRTPAAPVISAVSPANESLAVAFSAPTHTGGSAITDYEYSFDGSTWVSFGSATAGTKTISSLTNGTAYTVRVRAVNSSGDGALVTAGSAVTPRATQTMTWSPGPTWVNTDIDTSVTLSPPPTVLGGVNVTYAVTSTTGDASCTISNPSTPTVSSISGSGTCVITATSAEDIYEEATATVTLTIFAGAGSGNACDQNVSGAATVATYEFGADCLVVFSAASSASWITPDSVGAGALLLIAGGGGGGTYGGGGAGELFEDTSFSFNSSPYTVTVGEGGDGGRQTNSSVNDGSDSAFGTLTANGGGAGGSIQTGADNDGSPARDGGSGGGGRNQGINTPQSGGSSVLTAAGVGFAGGDGNKTAAGARIAGGGGGAGGPGGDADTSAATAGDGGIGAVVALLNASEAEEVSLGEVDGDVVRFAGGGGGGNNGGGTGGAGGLGGGGRWYRDGLANSGSGGGGSFSTGYDGKAGGSGVVIIRYTRAAQSALAVTSSASSVAFGSAVTLSVSGGSGVGAETLALTSGDCALSDSTLTATGGAGNCVVTATKAADSNYVASTATVTVGLTKAAQSALSITVDDNTLAYLETATLSSSGGSGVGAVTFSVDSGDCSVSGTTVTATGGTTDCVMSALKAADDDYLEASSSNTVTISISKAAQTITFGALTGKSYGATDFSVASTSSSGLSVSFTSNDTDVCAVSGSTVSIVAVGTCSMTANQGGNSFYSSATGVTQTFSVSAKAITVSVIVADKLYDAGTTATVSSGVLSGVVSGDTVSFVAANAAAAFGTAAVASGKAVTVTLDGDELSGADAGNYSLTVSGSPIASITAKPVTVDVTPAGRTYDGTQTATVSSSTLVGMIVGDTVSVDEDEITVVFTAPGAGTRTATATVTSLVLTGSDSDNYSATVGTVSSGVISKATQSTVSIVSASSMVFGQSLTLVGSGGSGSGALSYAKVSGPCTVASGVVTPSGAGTCVVTATRAADDNYNSATSSNVSITVAQASQSVNFTSTVPSTVVSGTQYTPVATATSSLAVTISIASGSPGVCGLAGGVVTFVASGTCVIQAAQAGNSDYVAAPNVTQTLVAGKINQTITFPSLAGKDFDDPAFLAGASVSTSRAVTYATSTSGVCGVNSTSGLINISATGTCTVTASSAGDSSYAAASDVSRSFAISPVVAGKPSITSVSFGDSSVTVAFSAPGFVGGDAIDAYQVVATASGGVVTKPDCATASPCTITGLTNGSSYTLTIAALNAAGVGPASTASPAIVPAGIPNAVSGLATTPGNGQLVVSWTALDTPGLGGGTFTRYDISLRVRGNSWSSPVTPDGTNNLATQSTAAHTFTGLVNGTSYDVQIVAITTANSTALSSNTATALGVPATVPDAPTALNVSSTSNTTAVASWSAPVDDGGAAISAYGVNVSCSFAVATDTFCSITGLTAGSRVTVSVGATNLMGTGASVSVAITMPGGSSGGSGGGGSSGGSSGASPTPAPTNPVVPRVIGPTIPTASPIPVSGPVVAPGRVFDPSVGTRATIGGAPATVAKTPLSGGGVSLKAGQVQLSFPQPSTAGRSANGDVSVPRGSSTTISGSGLLPGSQVQFFLPGSPGGSRELARVSVGAGGEFDAPLSMASRQFETPVPIGPQVMQIVGYDARGNQTVVDMVINVGQGAPAPELNRLENALPVLAGGQSLGTSGGEPEVMEILANEANSTVVARSDSWSFTVDVADTGGDVQAVPAGATIILVQSSVAVISGEGFQSGTRVDVWLFSDPTLLGSVTVSGSGTVSGEFFLDPRFAVVGSHTLQLQGVGVDGFIKAANMGVSVVEPVVMTSSGASVLLWSVAGVSGLVLAAVLVFVVSGARRRRA